MSCLNQGCLCSASASSCLTSFLLNFSDPYVEYVEEEPVPERPAYEYVVEEVPGEERYEMEPYRGRGTRVNYGNPAITARVFGRTY